MPRRVLVAKDGVSFDLVESPAPSEHHLQEVVKLHPQLIPAEDLGLDGDLLVVGRETTLASGAIDLLCLARTGDVVLVEFKTGPQNPDFRAALAQLIDYGSDLWRTSVDEFDKGVVQRYFAGGRAATAGRDLASAIAGTDWALDEDEYGELESRLGEVLVNGDFTYVVAAQRFTEQMKASLEYLNSTMRYGRFYLVEVVQLTGSDLTAHAAQVVASPPRRTGSAGPARGPRGSTDEATFLAGLVDHTHREAMAELFAACATLGVEVKWRSKGLALRIQTPDRVQPLSIGWAFQSGDSWSVARDLTLGVDRSSLAGTPSVAVAVEAFLATVRAIPGGDAKKGKALDAVVFPPATIASALPRIIASLEQIVQAVGGTEA